ncbi:MAG: hypothetical protein IKV35_00905 [Clostridia bacterium]|nr:hypothetical protein [Clostridia bacterium]
MKRIIAMLITGAMLCALTACSQAEVPEGLQPNTVQTSATAPKTPLFTGTDEETGVMTFAKLMNLSAKMWTAIDGFEHTDVDATHATFPVSLFENGGDCALNITYDAASDTILEATLVYKDTVVDAFANDPSFAVRPILQAMKKDMVELDTLAGVSERTRADFEGKLGREIDATHASYVAHSATFDNEATLFVTFDEATGAVTEATLSYKDTTVNAYGNDLATLEILSIMMAEDEAANQ